MESLGKVRRVREKDKELLETDGWTDKKAGLMNGKDA